MGLDITAYERITWEADQEQANQDYETETRPMARVYINPDFVAPADGLETGYYRHEGEEMSFRAGSYSGYNQWRRWLASLVGITPEQVWNDPQPGPFVELINFSDCEGAIGPATSAKLAADFEAWEDRAYQHATDKWNWERYCEWKQAFKLAAKGGFVKFH